MNKIADKLGVDHANNVLLDLAISKDYWQIFHHANPCLKKWRFID